MAYGVAAADVRLVVGIKTTDVSDTDMATIIANAEYEVDRLLNTTCIPRRVIEKHLAPRSESFVMLRNTPVTRVSKIQAGGTAGQSIDPNNTKLESLTGKLFLMNAAEKANFDDDSEEGNLIEYYYAKMEEEQGTETTLSVASGTGDGTEITIGTTGSFTEDDYVKLEGIDGNSEITKILAIGTGTVSADISWVHQKGSRVVRVVVPFAVKELVRVIAGIMTALHMVGKTYTFATSYSIPEHAVTKGVPYPHFQKVLDQLVAKRDYLLKRLRPQTAVG